jgi:hypothetical protein
MIDKNIQNRTYHHKHDYATAYRNDPYSPWEDLIIHRQKHPQTNEHMTLAEIAKMLARSLDGIEGRRKWLKKHPGYVLNLLESPDHHFEKLEESYLNFIKRQDYANISSIS